ncbi:MAG TPA: ATP synthase F1 subunit gamma [Bacteroidia bacterium]|nr:ATP synthase F1 subunit gamma [Bacteroidia bacterium]HRS59643.1 ATP synthase F1 subunit gamma [Bacteroidia bacterium]
MANLKAIRLRISSVKSTQQITKAMKMVSAAKFKKAQDAILRMRPYAAKINEIIQPLAKSVDDLSQNPYYRTSVVGKILIIPVTSDKGLCGSFNSFVIRETMKFIESQQALGRQVSLLCIGKKAYDYFNRKGFQIIDKITDISGNVPFGKIVPYAEKVMNLFEAKEFDEIRIIYNAYKNPAVYITTNEQYLPVQPADNQKEEPDLHGRTDFIFEPSMERIIDELVPASLQVKFYRIVLESNAAEHGARMTAMDKATENAEELLYELRLFYNKERQAAITKELLEIVSGAQGLQ